MTRLSDESVRMLRDLFAKHAERGATIFHQAHAEELLALAEEVIAMRSETARITPVGLVKMIQSQRDEIWEAALALLQNFDVRVAETDFERAVIALRAACDKVPSYAQRLDNIFKGLADVE